MHFELELDSQHMTFYPARKVLFTAEINYSYFVICLDAYEARYKKNILDSPAPCASHDLEPHCLLIGLVL